MFGRSTRRGRCCVRGSRQSTTHCERGARKRLSPAGKQHGRGSGSSERPFGRGVGQALTARKSTAADAPINHWQEEAEGRYTFGSAGGLLRCRSGGRNRIPLDRGAS